MQHNNQMMIDIFLKATFKAGEFVQQFRRQHDLSVTYKEDLSPVTYADIEAHHIIQSILSQNIPDLPIISEEFIPALSIGDKPFILLDPIDGTKCYIQGRDDYSINLALVEKNRPVLGVIYLPEEKKAFYAAYQEGSFEYNFQKIAAPKKLSVSCKGLDKVNMTLSPFSKDTKDTFQSMVKYPITDLTYAGSAKKFTLIASAKADFYPRLGQTGEWDTAAGDLLIHEAGGSMHQGDKNKIFYGKESFLNEGFWAYSSQDIFVN